jgi:hypothetical protein
MRQNPETHGLSRYKSAEELGMPKHEQSPFEHLRQSVLLLQCRVVQLEEKVSMLKSMLLSDGK